MLCAYVLQCGSVQRINDYGFVCPLSVCVYFSMHRWSSRLSVCKASVPLFLRSKGLILFNFDVKIVLISFDRVTDGS